MKFREELVALKACEEATEWVGNRDKKQALAECERPDWMLWYLAKTCGKQGSRKHCLVVSLAADCAETALKYVPAGEERPRLAIEAARRWATQPTPAHLEQCRVAAADAAFAAFAGNAYNYAKADAYTAAYAAAAAVSYAAYAANVANYAAYANADAATKRAAELEMCAMIRAKLKRNNKALLKAATQIRKQGS